MTFLYRAMLHVAALVTLVLASVALPLGALARDDDNRFGTWIYTGTVDEIGEQPVEHLGELERERDGDDFYYIPFNFGAVETDVFWEDEEDADLTIDQLLAEPHVVVVREGEQSDSAIVAAGNVEGETDPRHRLLVMLEPVGEASVTGLAYLVPDDKVDDETEITIIVWEVELTGTPAA